MGFRRTAHDSAARDGFVAVAEHQRELYRYFARRCPEAADDLMGDLWVAAVQSSESFDAELGAVRPWLFGIARNVLLTHWRKEKRQRSLTARLAVDRSQDSWADVDRRLDAAAVAGSLRRDLARLPARDREVLLLVAWEDLTPTEIAQMLGISAATVRTRLHRARARMQVRQRERSALE